MSEVIYLAITAPIGTDITAVRDTIERTAMDYNYSFIGIKLTELLNEVVGSAQTTSDLYDVYRYKIDSANHLRKISGLKSILARLAVSKIYSIRSKNQILPRTIIFLNQIKNEDEVDFLREVYGSSFFLLSLYSNPEKRVLRLANNLYRSDPVLKTYDERKADAATLLSIDANEPRNTYGQRIEKTFPLGDFFINVDSLTQLNKQIDRILSLLLNAPNISPSKDELFMYMAHVASYRSLDLSRQVGAIIINSQSEVVSIGCNEVPKAHGGFYWADDVNDSRDYFFTGDENEFAQKEILKDFLQNLEEDKLLAIEKEKIGDLIEKSISGKSTHLSKSKIFDSIEHSRVVHAEMAAITTAARETNSILGSTLYCTTFPCHLCAKHILSSGIKEVVFLEPYPKSRTLRLFPDSIVLHDDSEIHHDKVTFRPFLGVSPNIFQQIFSRKTKRKDDRGYPIKFIKSQGKFKFPDRFHPKFSEIEEQHSIRTAKAIRAFHKKQN